MFDSDVHRNIECDVMSVATQSWKGCYSNVNWRQELSSTPSLGEGFSASI